MAERSSGTERRSKRMDYLRGSLGVTALTSALFMPSAQHESVICETEGSSETFSANPAYLQEIDGISESNRLLFDSYDTVPDGDDTGVYTYEEQRLVEDTYDLTHIGTFLVSKKIDDVINEGGDWQEQVEIIDDFTKQNLGFETNYKLQEGTESGKQPDGSQEQPAKDYKLADLMFTIDKMPKELFEKADIGKVTIVDGEVKINHQGKERTVAGYFSSKEGSNNDEIVVDIDSANYWVLTHELVHGLAANVFSEQEGGVETYLALNPPWFTYTDQFPEDWSYCKERMAHRAVKEGVVVSRYAATNVGEDLADTFPTFVNYSGLDLRRLKEASEIQRKKFFTILAMIEQEIPDYTDYLLNLAQARISDLRSTPAS
jgi:hypothetical protein